MSIILKISSEERVISGTITISLILMKSVGVEKKMLPSKGEETAKHCQVDGFEWAFCVPKDVSAPSI